jgi:hypothetical protein
MAGHSWHQMKCCFSALAAALAIKSVRSVRAS